MKVQWNHPLCRIFVVRQDERKCFTQLHRRPIVWSTKHVTPSFLWLWKCRWVPGSRVLFTPGRATSVKKSCAAVAALPFRVLFDNRALVMSQCCDVASLRRSWITCTFRVKGLENHVKIKKMLSNQAVWLHAFPPIGFASCAPSQSIYAVPSAYQHYARSSFGSGSHLLKNNRAMTGITLRWCLRPFSGLHSVTICPTATNVLEHNRFSIAWKPFPELSFSQTIECFPIPTALKSFWNGWRHNLINHYCSIRFIGISQTHVCYIRQTQEANRTWLQLMLLQNRLLQSCSSCLADVFPTDCCSI